MADTILNKKLDAYSNDNKLNNFIEDNELTVLITLNEYRYLISSEAQKEAEISKANNDRYERNREIENLKKQVRELENKVFDYRKVFGELPDIEVEE